MTPNRIILDPKPRLPQLPPYVEIDNGPIREAAAAWDAAKAALDESKKTLVQLEQELPNAHLEDARADERLRAEGKAKLKGRPATQAAEKAIADAAHEHLVAQLGEETAFNGLQDALDKNQAEWAESVESDTQRLDAEWAEAINAIVSLHRRRVRALVIRAMVVGGDERTAVAALGLKPSQIRNLDFGEGTTDRMTGWVDTGDVFAKLADLGMPEPPKPEPVQHPPLRPRPMFRSDSKEAAEQRQYRERLESPEGRAQVEEERRKRAELVRQQNEAVEL